MARVNEYQSFLNQGRLAVPQNNKLPAVSTNLDSVRTYSFEVQFKNLPPSLFIGSNTYLTLAAKKVTSAGHGVEDIAVRRLNDVLYYPGAATTDELTITFDHLIYNESTQKLFDWFRTCTYDPRTGQARSAAGAKVGAIDVVFYDNGRNPVSVTTYFGAYPKSFKPAESNYSTANEFHTFEVAFRYDFMDYRHDATYANRTKAESNFIGPTL